MADRRVAITLVGAVDSDADELDELTRRLRRHLLDVDLDVRDVQPVLAGDAPAGSKSNGAVALGALAVTLAPLAVRGLLDVLAAWVRDRPVRGIRLTVGDATLEIDKASAEDQRRIIESFVAAIDDAGDTE